MRALTDWLVGNDSLHDFLLDALDVSIATKHQIKI